MPSRTQAAAVLCAVALSLTTTIPSTAAPVRGRATAFEGAEAAWLVRRGDDVFIYYAFVFRARKAANDPTTRLFTDRSRCRVHRVRGRSVASCTLEGRLRTIRPARFEMNPGSGAELNTRNHQIVWRGRGVPSLEAEPWIDTEAVLVDAFFERRARARGKVFDRRMRRRTLDRGVLFWGADVGVVTDLGSRSGEVRSTIRVQL